MRTKFFNATLAIALPLLPCGCVSQTTSKPALGSANKSWTSKFSDAMKDGAGKATAALTPKAEAPPDPISLSNKSKKKNPDLYVTMGLAAERSGKSAEAEKLYKKALEVAPNDAGALLAYGHLLDRRGQLAEATKLYQKCCKKHPESAAAFNDLGLCLHRQGQLKESSTALREAVRLKPDRKLYSNNLATVLVDQGSRDEAFRVLATAHGTSAAHYNLGYLLEQHGDSQAALEQFQKALVADPTLVAAQQWVDKLSPGAMHSTPMLAESQHIRSYPVETPTVEMPSQPSSGRYADAVATDYGTSPSSSAGSYYSEGSTTPRETTRAYPVKYPQQPRTHGELGEVPPTPAEAGIELLPPIPADLN